MSDSSNIFWSEIPKTAKVYDLGRSYFCRFEDGKTALVYWTGEDAAKAQRWLKANAIPGPVPA